MNKSKISKVHLYNIGCERTYYYFNDISIYIYISAYCTRGCSQFIFLLLKRTKACVYYV